MTFEIQQKNAPDFFDLAERYFKGTGVSKNWSQAFKYYKQAADLGHLDAQYKTGVCYVHGFGTSINYKESIKWLQRAAERHHAGAQDSLGVRYMTGQGVKKNEQEAFKWFLKAALQNHIVAQFNLAMIYLHGKGIERDLIQAYVWFSLSADQGDELALQSMRTVENMLSEPELAQCVLILSELRKKYRMAKKSSIRSISLF
jgi:TPR repeat protein